MQIRNVIALATILINSFAIADPMTDILFGKDVSEAKILEYYSRHYIKEKGSLPIVSSVFNDGETRIRGSSFIIQYDDGSNNKKLLVSNAHLLEGESKRLRLNHSSHGLIFESPEFKINDDDVYLCSDNDIAIVDLSSIEQDQKLTAFASIDKRSQKILTHGMNNSPRGFYLMDYFDEGGFKNQNKRPIFENTYSKEMLHFVQMGNMYDLSCNYYPSSPEPYEGNALFIPISTFIKENSTNPHPFVQKIFNRVNSLFVHMARVKNGECKIELTGKLAESKKIKRSLFSDNIIVPAGIRPGMSGLPLVHSDDLKQSEYEIIGMVTSYNRRMQSSHFVASKHILGCIEQSIKNSDKKKADQTYYNYSSDYATLFRSDAKFSEIPLITQNAGDNVLGNGGDGSGGNGGDGLAGNGDKADAPLSGIMFKGEHVLGFNCTDKKSEQSFPIFANWESRYIVNSANYECSPIKGNEDIRDLIARKANRKKANGIKAANKTLKDFKLNMKLIEQKKSDDIALSITGLRYSEKEKKKIKFKIEHHIPSKLEDFEPHVNLKLEDGSSIVLDLRELMFINLENVYQGEEESVTNALLKVKRPRLFGTYQCAECESGSIPLELIWDK